MRKKTPIGTLIFIVVLSAIALLIDMPAKLPINIAYKKLQIHTELLRPNIQIRAFGASFVRDLELKMGLDIQGGTRVVLQADMKDIASKDRQDALQSSREVIARRVDLFGVSESVVKTSVQNDQYRIIVELPGVTNAAQAVSIIGTTAQLDFREEATKSAIPVSPTTPNDVNALFANYQPTGLTGKDLRRSTVQFDNKNGQPVVSLEFNDLGQKKFAEITTRNQGKRVGIFLDNQPVANPTVNEPILNGNAIISGGFTVDTANELSIQMNAGALPVPIQIVQQETIGASLGQDSVQKTAIAGFIGVGLVAVFMILLYGWKGVLADLALGVYAIITVAVYKLAPITITLPGIAGLLLSVGMAVDSNILIFERMKEELRLGKPFELAMNLGFGRAWDSIKDANVATLFTSFILFNPFEFEFLNRSGMVRGFALTLALGIAISLFTGIVVTRTLLRVFLKDPTKEKKHD